MVNTNENTKAISTLDNEKRLYLTSEPIERFILAS